MVNYTMAVWYEEQEFELGENEIDKIPYLRREIKYQEVFTKRRPKDAYWQYLSSNKYGDLSKALMFNKELPKFGTNGAQRSSHRQYKFSSLRIPCKCFVVRGKYG